MIVLAPRGRHSVRRGRHAMRQNRSLRPVAAMPLVERPQAEMDPGPRYASASSLDARLANTVARSPAARTTRVLALVPAHNEAGSITETILSLRAQTRPVDEIVVVVNNSTDDTADIARELGVSVWDVGAMGGRKAGALNLALDRFLPHLDDDDLLLSMDADTVLTDTLIENALRHFAADAQLGALSSNHVVMRHRNLLELLQAMEYEHDRVMIGRHKGRGGCMTGMAAVFRVAALREVKATYGTVYDPSNWTEDWKLTIALRHTRWHTLRPQDCLVSTVPVSRIRGLIHQRERWARGYLQTLMQFGWTRVTAVPWTKQLGFAFSIAVRLLFLTVLGLLIAYREPLVAWWMLPIALVFSADAIWTVRRTGRAGMLVAGVLFIEIGYAWLLTAAIARGYVKQLIDYKGDINNTWMKVREG